MAATSVRSQCSTAFSRSCKARSPSKAGRPFWVGHELTAETQGYLRRGIMSIVLDQAPEVQARRSIDLALNRLGLIEVEVSAEPVRFLTITPENL